MVPPHGADRRLDNARPPPNGTRATILLWLIALALSATVSYFISLGTMQKDAAIIKATEESHFAEVLRRLELLQQDIRELRLRP